MLILGGGSNLVVSDEGFDGTVIQVATRGVSRDGGPGVLTVAAGEDWDAVVARSVAEGLAGLECLSGIPGLTGATPIQNVGAYGQEVAETITRGAGLRPGDRRRPGDPERAVRFRLPDQPVPRRRAVRRAECHVPAGGAGAVRPGPLRRAGRRPRRPGRRPGGERRGPGGGHRAQAAQGHGDRPRRPRHPQRRLVLRQPGAGRARAGRGGGGRPGQVRAADPGAALRGAGSGTAWSRCPRPG